MDTDIRVRLRFITHDASIRVTEAPLAVPVQLNRKGLSEVINHLRTATSGASKGNNEEEEEATDTHTHTQTQLYDFVIENQLLRCSLEKFLRATGLSTETTVTVEYFRSLSTPEEGPTSEKSETWIGALTECHPSPSSTPLLLAGCYDGALRCYTPSTTSPEILYTHIHTHAHAGPIKAITSFLPSSEYEGMSMCVTGGKDKLVKVWRVSSSPSPSASASSTKGGSKKKNTHTHTHTQATIKEYATLTGHENSVECVCVNGTTQVLSGDWGGMLYLWKLTETHTDTHTQSEAEGASKKKRRKTNNKKDDDMDADEDTHTHTHTHTTLQPLIFFKAHAQCISTVAFHNTHTHTHTQTIYTSSWDHSIKQWDLERQDNTHTLTGSKVVTTFALSPSAGGGGLLAAGHPDGRVRVWDVRGQTQGHELEKEKEGEVPVAGKKVLAGCGSWISGVAWHPHRDNVLASISHDGQVRIWDLRATKPLYTLEGQTGGEKGLAVCFSNTHTGTHTDTDTETGGVRLYAGGAEGVVRGFVLP